jgi:hypothetical protein
MFFWFTLSFRLSHEKLTGCMFISNMEDLVLWAKSEILGSAFDPTIPFFHHSTIPIEVNYTPPG